MGRTHASRVLIADSDPKLRQLLYGALLAEDVFSDCVSSVPDAIAKLGEEQYGVILVDVGLPGGNAEQIVATIAKLRHALRPVVLVLAANPTAARSLDVDIVQIVLRKPLAFRQTVALIRSCVESTAACAAAEDGDGDDQGSLAIS